jgi:glycosyltransferase involved in cell wall biosynthesis
MRPRLLFNVNVAWFFISHRLEIARAAQAAGFDVHLVSDVESEQEVEQLARERITFHRVRLSRGGLAPSRDLSYAVNLARVIRTIGPDIIHNITVKPIVYGSIAGRALKVPRIVNAVSGLGYSFSGSGWRRILSLLVTGAYRLALGRADIRVIFQNSDDRNSFIDAGMIAPGQAVIIRGSGVDLDAFSFTPEPDGTPIVVLPARMLRDKGVVEFAEAAKLLRSQGCEASFLMAGKTDEANPASLSRAELTQLREDAGVQWLGHVLDIQTLYRSAHVVCLPSYREGLPKALIEACAAGRPIVTTDVPGCRETVENEVNGLLCKPRDVRTLADALGRLLRDPALRRRMGAASRRKAEAEFDVRAVVQATLDLYREMLALC